MAEAAPERGASTRGQILAVALEQFRAQGYDRTSLRMIADQLGMTKAALYYHFPAKDDLLAALVEPFRRRVDELFHRQPGAGTAQVEAFLQEYLDVLFAEYDVVRWCATDPAALCHEHLGAWLRAMRERLHEVLTGGHGGDRARVRAAGAIGVVHAAMFLPREVAVAHRDQLVASALSAFAE